MIGFCISFEYAIIQIILGSFQIVIGTITF
jgi:hypothetical protein